MGCGGVGCGGVGVWGAGQDIKSLPCSSDNISHDDDALIQIPVPPPVPHQVGLQCLHGGKAGLQAIVAQTALICVDLIQECQQPFTPWAEADAGERRDELAEIRGGELCIDRQGWCCKRAMDKGTSEIETSLGIGS